MKLLSAGWPEIREKVRAAGELALLLDYDGTLTPIAGHPSKARLAAGTRRLLSRMASQEGIWIAVISGRALKDVRALVGVSRICCVGNHGLEIQGPDLQYVNPKARESRPVISEIARRLRKALHRIPGVWVEDKGLTLSVHFRQAASDCKRLARGRFHEAVRPYQKKRRVRITTGKEVLEVRPLVRWTKGTVVNWLLARRTALAGGPVFPVYMGDDLTDEDAFRALSKRGATVVVGAANPLSRARYRAASSSEAVRFLRRLFVLVSERGADGAGSRDQRRAQRHAARRA